MLLLKKHKNCTTSRNSTWDTCLLLVGMEKGATTVENGLVVLQDVKQIIISLAITL